MNPNASSPQGPVATFEPRSFETPRTPNGGQDGTHGASESNHICTPSGARKVNLVKALSVQLGETEAACSAAKAEAEAARITAAATLERLQRDAMPFTCAFLW